VVYIQTVSLSL